MRRTPSVLHLAAVFASATEEIHHAARRTGAASVPVFVRVAKLSLLRAQRRLGMEVVLVVLVISTILMANGVVLFWRWAGGVGILMWKVESLGGLRIQAIGPIAIVSELLTLHRRRRLGGLAP